MPVLHILILALIQGVSEFLPISSSGHLLLFHEIAGNTNAQENLLLDVAVHVGTLFSVLIYFRKDVGYMALGLYHIAKGDVREQYAKLNIYILISSIPVIAAGFTLQYFNILAARNIEVIAWTTLIFGILLWIVDTYSPQKRVVADLNWKSALGIGVAQVFALIPGTSRSGVTMTAARYFGFTRSEAARYSLLLSIIAISGAGTLGGLGLIEIGNLSFTIDIALAAGLAFISGLIAIDLMMKWLKRSSFTPFVIYRIGLGALLLAIVYGGFSL